MTDTPVPERASVTSLDAYRLALRAEVLARYHPLKDKGVNEQTARNTAAAQASLYAKLKPNPRAGVYRRELDDALAPNKRLRPGRDASPNRPIFTGPHWRLPE